jgi:prepilin peptidase CpaA
VGQVQTAVTVVAIAILAAIALADIRTRRIPNALSIVVAALGLVRILLVHDLAATGYTFGAAAVVFGIAFLLFWRGAIGGGDAKLVAAMVLLIGYHDLLGFLLLMSLCGGVVALAILAQDKLRPRLSRLQRSTVTPSSADCGTEPPSVPYGVAIAAAGIITLIL